MKNDTGLYIVLFLRPPHEASIIQHIPEQERSRLTMSQLSLYLDNDTFSKLSSAAKENGQSLSRYTAAIIDEHFSAKAHTDEEVWHTLRELYDSAKPDETFTEPPEIPWEFNRLMENFE
ncbi:MAG: hypothetical protein LBT31_10510 [Synergistaceae bacterium]|jgi:hypothetical protein|nr:hypothetical protein [Synergistaceae bacterium]